jgi:hypothetical protein
MDAPPGAPTFVKLSLVVQRTMERAYGALAAVMDEYVSRAAVRRPCSSIAPPLMSLTVAGICSAASKSDKERKQLLYEWFTRTRASVIRLLVVLKWARTVPDINHTRVRRALAT